MAGVVRGVYPPQAWPEPWLAQRALRSPRAPALVCGAEELGYRDLDERARALAAALQGAGVRADEPVGLLMESGVALAVACHALRYCRAVLLPLNLRLSPAEWGDLLAAAGARWLLHAVDDPRGPAAGGAAPGPIARLALGAGDSVRALDPAPPPRSRPAREAGLLRGACAVLFTSGTSGRPKGAVLGPENLLASARGAARLLGDGPGDRWLACLPLYHVGGLALLFRSCLAGGTLVLHRGFCAADVLRDLHTRAITQVSLVAAMLERVLGEAGTDRAPAALRCVLLGGGPAPEALLERAREQGFPVASTYGLTEAASQVATRLPGESARPLAGCLSPLPGVAVRIEPARRGAGAGEVGEICVRGPNVMRGYLGAHDSASLRGGWLHTGDLGILDALGRLTVLDRRDDLIVSGGENIYPAEVEAVLLRHPAVADAAVVGVPDARFGARPMAYWVAADGGDEAVDLRGHCRQHLGAYKVPDVFRRVASLPRNTLGKLQRGVLRARASGEFIAPEAEQFHPTVIDLDNFRSEGR